MQKEEITALFDRQAAGYDQQWHRLSPINGALHLLADAVLAELPPEASLLCVGTGTGAEVLHFAEAFPGWRFTVVEPSAPMMEVFRGKAEARGILSRCTLHAGYLDSLPPGAPCDAATAFLVSQFIMDWESRTAFFKGIARRLRPGGLLVSSDLAGDLASAEGASLLRAWFRVMSANGVSEEGVQRLRDAYTRDVAVIPPPQVRDLIARGGFESPVQFFQAGLVHAWHTQRAANVD